MVNAGTGGAEVMLVGFDFGSTTSSAMLCANDCCGGKDSGKGGN